LERLTLKQALRCFETSQITRPMTQCHIQQDLNLQKRLSKKLKSHKTAYLIFACFVFSILRATEESDDILTTGNRMK